MRTAPEIRVEPRPQLSEAAVGGLAHDLRGALHTILGHSELLALDAVGQGARDSATHIHDAAERLNLLCEDIVDLLRLPDLVDQGSTSLAIDALVASLNQVAARRGAQVRLLEPCAARSSIVVDATVRRIVAHVVEHVVRSVNADVRVSLSTPQPADRCLITVAPIPEHMTNHDDDGFSMAGALLAARGAHLRVVGWRLELLVPVLG